MTADRPLRILLVGDYADDSTLGSSKVFLKLQSEFAALGHACDIVWDSEIGGPRNRQVRQLVSPWRAGAAIRRRLDAGQYDVVDAASAEGLWFGIARWLGRYTACAYICRSNGVEQLNYQRMIDDARVGLSSKPWTRRMWYPMSRLSQVAAAARLADRLILVNETDRRYALERGWQPEDRIHLVGHGIADEFLRSDPGADAPRGAGLLFCGSWDQVKGISYLRTAFTLLHERGLRPSLTVLGPGVAPGVVIDSFDERVRPFVRVLPRVPEADVMQVYRAHDVLLWTSTYEGFGLVLLEAMSQRMAVVSTPVGCAPALISDGVTGLSVPLRSAEAIAAAAGRLLCDGTLRRTLGESARRAVAAMSWRSTALATLSVYRRARGTTAG